MTPPFIDRRGPRAAAVLLSAILLSLPGFPMEARAQHHHAGAVPEAPGSGEEFPGGISRAFLERPIALNPALTRIRHRVEAASPEARAFYEQGLTYHYLYHYLDAVRSFQQALRLDPELLPAYAGLSRALASLEARDEALRILDRAEAIIGKRVAGDDPPLDALGVRLVELRRMALEARNDEARRRYGEELDRALDHHPDDVELLMLRAMNSRGHERIHRLEALLEMAPDHVGARHQLVHSYERTGSYVRSLEHGRILADLAPTVPHGLHMYGHSLVATGRVGEALERFSTADSLERAYFAREGIPEHYDWHHPHNLHLLGLALWHQGRGEEAEAVLRRRAALDLAEPDASAWLGAALAELLVAEGRAPEALEVAGEMQTADHPIPRFQAGLLKAEAYLLMEDPDQAQAALDGAVHLLDELGARGDPGAERRIRRIEVQILLHRGEVAEVEPRLPELLEDLLDYGGPDGWIVTVLELHNLARSAREAGAQKVAGQIQEALARHEGGTPGR